MMAGSCERAARRPWLAGPAAALALAWAACSSAPDTTGGPQDGPPTVAQVRDGFGADVDRPDVRPSLFADWAVDVFGIAFLVAMIFKRQRLEHQVDGERVAEKDVEN